MSARSFSQEFSPIGATWHYPIKSFLGANIINPAVDSAQYVKCICVQDSFFFGKMARMVQCRGYSFNNFNPTGPGNSFFYQNGDTIFRFFGPQGRYIRFQYLNTAINDTLLFESSFSASTDQLLTFKVDTIFYETFNNEIVKRVELQWLDTNDISSGPGISSNIYYEGIGGRFGFIPFSAVIEQLHVILPIRCYESPLTSLINFGTRDCEYRLTSSILDNNKDDMLKVYPIPCENLLKVDISKEDFQDIHVIILNSIGQKVFDNLVNITHGELLINTSNFNKGVYHLSIYNKEILVNNRKFIKI